METLTLHQKAVEWLCSHIPKAINNHYGKKLIFDGCRPDILVDEELNEVEVVSDKSKCAKLDRVRNLWIVVPSYKIYSKITLIWEEQGQFFTEPDQLYQLYFPEEMKRLQEEINGLKATRNELIREKEALLHEVKMIKKISSKSLYILPSFEFKDEINEDNCIICNKRTDVVIDNQKLGMRYGLCQRHFERILIAEK
jgi:hypothetical protein